ncbi:MAG: hypothetical protein WA871_09705 [Candidatus Acidiferrales bacterium]
MATEKTGSKEKMTTGELIELLGMSLAIVLLAAIGLAFDFLTHLLSSMDGLLLFMVCLMMGGVFTLMLLLYANDAGWLPKRRRKSSEPAPQTK